MQIYYDSEDLTPLYIFFKYLAALDFEKTTVTVKSENYEIYAKAFVEIYKLDFNYLSTEK